MYVYGNSISLANFTRVIPSIIGKLLEHYSGQRLSYKLRFKVLMHAFLLQSSEKNKPQKDETISTTDETNKTGL